MNEGGSESVNHTHTHTHTQKHTFVASYRITPPLTSPEDRGRCRSAGGTAATLKGSKNIWWEAVTGSGPETDEERLAL